MSFILGILGGGLSLLKRIPWQAYVAVLLAIVAYVAVQKVETKIADARVAGFTAGRDSRDTEFKDAQAAADKFARAQVAATVKAQASISKGKADAFDLASDDIDRRAAALRVRYDEVTTAYADRNSGRVYDPTAVPFASDKPVEAAPNLCVPYLVALPAFTEAERNTAQLNAILDWYEEQAALAELEPVE